MYNWFTINTGKLCPTGWHVPSKSEWMILQEVTGGNNIGGGKLKETGTSHWKTPNTGATNETGFNGLPSGSRSASGYFSDLGTAGFWWSTDAETTLGIAYLFDLQYNHTAIQIRSNPYSFGYSIRCLKN